MILFKRYSFFIPLFFYILNVGYQLIFLNTGVINTFTDEGIYLYDMKLILEGYIPYKDFFLAHPPYLILLFAPILKIVNFNPIFFDYIYTLWNLSVIFPLYFIVKKITNSYFISSIAILLFIFFPEYQLLDARFFALRLASLPFLVWGMYAFFNKKLSVSAILLGIFSICLVTNVQVTILFIACMIIGDYIFERQTFHFSHYKKFLLLFFTITSLGYLIVFLIPHGIENILAYHANRYFVGYYWRFLMLNYIAKRVIILSLLSILGSFVLNKKTRLLPLWSFFSMVLIIFGSKSFATFYLNTLLPGFIINASILISYISTSFIKKTIVSTLVVGLLFLFSFPAVFSELYLETPSSEKALMRVLQKSPEPQLMDQPMYSFYTQKKMTFYYYVADLGYYKILGARNVNDQKLMEAFLKSKTIVMSENLRIVLSKNFISQIRNKYTLKKRIGEYEVFIKR